MKRIVRVLKILISFLVVIFIINFLYSLFMVGSYPYAEQYILNGSEDKVINEIQKLKQKEFSLQVPLDSSSFGGLIDERNGNMYYVYFLLKDRKTVVLCYVKRIDNCTTTLGLISVGEGSRFLNNRTINARSYFLLRDLSRNENKQFKKDLEEQVLDKLNIEWKKIDGDIVFSQDLKLNFPTKESNPDRTDLTSFNSAKASGAIRAHKL